MVISLLLVVTGAQLVYWWYYYYFSFKKYTPESKILETFPSVSVVICFKGLPHDFEHNLNKIMDQDYPAFELVLINDFSPTSDVNRIQEWIKNQNRTNIQWVDATIDKPGKKHALREGISHCSHDILLFTDIDCYPDSSSWIKKMAQNQINHQTDVVLGYGPMVKSKGSVAWFSGFETLLTAMQYFSHFFAGAPYMSVGRNWLVKKEIYLNNAGKASGQNLPSGDDDLLFQALVLNHTISACLDKDTFVFSTPKTSLSSFLRQKTRHITTAVKYPIKTQAILFVFAASFPFFYGVALWVILSKTLSASIILIFCLVKWSIQSFLHIRIIKTLQGTQYLAAFPFGEMALAVYFPLLSIWSFFGVKKW